MPARPLAVALLAASFVASSLGGCSCHRLLPEETVERSLRGPSIERVADGEGSVGAEVAWAGLLTGADDEGRWTFDALDVPDEARVRGIGLSGTEFVDADRIARTGRTYAVGWKGHDVRDLPSYPCPPVVGRAYVVYGVVTSTRPPVLEIARVDGFAQLLEVRIREPLPALDDLGFVRGHWETRKESESRWLPAVVFLPESASASEQAIAAYVESALGANAAASAVLGVDDSPWQWSAYVNTFDRMTRGAAVPFVVIDAKGHRRAELRGLDEPKALRDAVELATRKAGRR